MYQNALKDALYNTCEKSGASVDYGKGVVVGIVSALMGEGHSFKVAWQITSCSLPKDWRIECIPEKWGGLND